MEISCIKCEKTIDLTDKDFADVICESCNQKNTAEHIADELEDPKGHREIRDGDDSYRRGYCCECETDGLVVRTADDVLVCSNCGAKYEAYETCQGCGHNNTGDMSDSAIYGCPVCSG